jgi:hypothetical protein
MIVDPSHSSYMGWITSGAYPGFVGGVIFSVLLRFAEGHHRFDELSLPRVGAWGALAGTLLGAIPFVVFGIPPSTHPLLAGGIIVGSASLLSALSASGSLALARRADRQEMLAVDSYVAEVGLTEAEVRELLGSGR